MTGVILGFSKRALGNLISKGRTRSCEGYRVAFNPSENEEIDEDYLRNNERPSEEKYSNIKKYGSFVSSGPPTETSPETIEGDEGGDFSAKSSLDSNARNEKDNFLDPPLDEYNISTDSPLLLPPVKYRTPLYHHPPNKLCFPQDSQSQRIYRILSFFGLLICSGLLVQVLFSGEFRTFYKNLQNVGLGSRVKSWSKNTILGNSAGFDESPNLVIDHTGSSYDPVQSMAPNLVVAGKLAVDGLACNLAQLDLNNRNWLLPERTRLTLYSGNGMGDVFTLLANHTGDLINSDGSLSSPRLPDGSIVSTSRSKGGNDVIVVGAFDTTYQNSQMTYCSVGRWDGTELLKVGEGLCNSALSKGMKITSAALAGPEDIFVAGSFKTKVWNGHIGGFINIYVAHYNALERVWSPLRIGQLSCSWCTVTVVALAWDQANEQLHIGGKFNRIDNGNIPAGLAIYNHNDGHLVAHPGGGVSMTNATQDGVVTAIQFDSTTGILYVMGSFDRLTATGEICHGIAAWEGRSKRWTCLADIDFNVQPSSSGNMILTPYGLFVAGRAEVSSTWPQYRRPYTVAVLKTTQIENDRSEFKWYWLPGFDGHSAPIHCLSNGFNEYAGYVFIGGDDLVGMWSHMKRNGESKAIPQFIVLTGGHVYGSVMAIAQMVPAAKSTQETIVGYNIVVYCITLGALIGMFLAILCNNSVCSTICSICPRGVSSNGISLDTLTYSAVESHNVAEAYERAMQTRFVQYPQLLTMINPTQVILLKIIGEGTFGRVWSAKWRSSLVAVKEFVFAQAAVAGKSSMRREIIEDIIGEAGMMAILRHPHVLQLYGCCLTSQAIWIVSELCSLGSLRQLLDDKDRNISIVKKIELAIQVAEGMTYLHSQDPPIIHRDLKSHNIFVHETSASQYNDMIRKAGENTLGLDAKIGDWGSARAALAGSRTMTHGVGTACWLAPEVIKHARSSKQSDVFGYGIILWELATREEVYRDLEAMQIIARVANEGLRPPVPNDCPWSNLMVNCWEENPANRCSFETIVKELHQILKVEKMKEDALEESYQNGTRTIRIPM